MHFDLIYLAMVRAVAKFGGSDGTFNAAGFGNAFAALAGVSEAVDGHIVRAMLCGRKDVEILYGGCHFRLIETKP